MPRVNIYIRNEDEAKWKSIADKPAWLHEHITMLPHELGVYEHADTLNEYFSKNPPKTIDPTYEPMEPTA